MPGRSITSSNPAPRRVSGAVAVVLGVALASLALAACGGSTPSSSATTATTSASGGATTSPPTTTSPSGAASSTASRLATLSQSLQNAETAPFKATYSATDSGKTETITFEQDPPKLAFVTTGGEVIDTGTATYFCSTAAPATCLSSSTEDPLSSLLDVLSPKTAVASLQAAQSALAAKTAGYDATFSSQTFAGQAATCVTIAASAGSEKVCVTGTGQLAYVSTSPSQVFELTSYSGSVDASDFALPAGATIETVPAG
ncbi:MAG: hypothetical protein ABSG81_02770 [Acidimicrobiales bacterium]